MASYKIVERQAVILFTRRCKVCYLACDVWQASVIITAKQP